MMVKTEAVVIGAGMAGLMAANWLQEAGRRALVLEADDTVGGRMATRFIGSGAADTGAQFFTTRTAVFQSHVDRWLKAGVVREWGRGWSDGKTAVPVEDGYPRYIGVDGMAAICRHLATSLTVETKTAVTAVAVDADGWLIKTDGGNAYWTEALLLTPPVPQSMALLEAGGATLAAADWAALGRVRYAPNLTGLFLIEGEVNLPAPGAVQQLDGAIVWMGDNQRKGISPEARMITMQASPGISKQLYTAADGAIVEFFVGALRRFMGKTAVIQQTEIKRWRYSLPVVLHPQRCLKAKKRPPLAFAGDAFQEPRVEGAALSGLAAAKALASE